MKKVVTLIIIFLTFLTINAAEPGTNIGKTKSQLLSVFPTLKYIKTDAQGQHYHDGEDPTEGVNCFFIINNDKVVEECMMVQDTNGFPLEWWRKVCDKFYYDYSYIDVQPKVGHYKFTYSYFTVDVIYIEEGNLKTAMVVYKAR